jgi:nucleoside-diphosphate-sugar epimerase
MRVLLAGATGAIGKYLVPQLLAAGHQVTGLVRRAGALNTTGADEIVADLLDRPAVLKAVEHRRFDAVIHQATDLARPPLIYPHMLTTNRLRTEGTSTLIAAARATRAKKFVTASVFYGYGFADFGEEPLLETDPFGQLSTPALDAVHQALLSNEQQTHAFGGVSLRYGMLYGDKPAPVVAADWDGELPMLHLADAASAAVRAMEKGRAGATYNIADEHPVSWRELQESAAIAAGRHFPVALPSWALRVSAPFAAELLTRTAMRLSTAKAKKELGWSPRYPSFAQGLRESIEVAASA